MSSPNPFTLAASRTLLRIFIGMNIVAGVFIAGLLVASFAAGDVLLRALTSNHGEPGQLAGMRVLMGIGIVAVPLTHVILTRLLAIVRTVGGGEPFVAENADRLKSIAWSLLGLELLHLAAVGAAQAASTKAVPIEIERGFSFTGWLAILLLFVLARVFERGAAMRDELEGMV